MQTLSCLLLILSLTLCLLKLWQVDGSTNWYSPEYDHLRQSVVKYVHLVERPLGCHDRRRHPRWAFKWSVLRLLIPKHTGVVVTLEDETNWLMERHGDSNTTMVTNLADIVVPCHNWIQIGCRKLRNSAHLTVEDFWNASHPNEPYSLLSLDGVNCHDVSGDMWSLTDHVSDPCHFPPS